MISPALLAFDDVDCLPQLAASSDSDIDGLEFGVIAFDAAGIVRRYNAVESQLAGLGRERVLALPLFELVAPCMNNALVAGRYAQAQRAGAVLDVTVNHVLTLRMRPTRAALRLLAAPEEPLRYLLLRRAEPAGATP